MLENFCVVGQQVVVLFILIAIGFVCNRTKFLNRETIIGMTDFVLYWVTPCLIIASFQRKFDPQQLGMLGIAFIVAFVYHFINIAFAHTVVRDKDKSRERVYRFGLVFSNAGYMSIPLQQALLGSEGVFYGAVIVAVFNFFLWSYGLVLMSGERKYISAKKMLLNPGVTSIVIGMICFMGSIELPKVILQPMQSLAALNTPVPMIVIGYHLADAQFKPVLSDLRVYLVMALRLVVVPIILFAAMMLMRIKDVNLIVAAVIAASAPVAAATTMFASRFKQNAVMSVGLVSYTTVVSIITMPLVVGTVQYLLKRG